MQVIYMAAVDAAEYAGNELHRQVKRPSTCPCCGARQSLRAIGFYTRSSTASSTGKIVSIKVRRFVCLRCRRTASILPSFAQPYRLICSITIQRHFENAASTLDTYRWRHLLRRYLKRFHGWVPQLLTRLGNTLGLPPPSEEDKWISLTRVWQVAEVENMTHLLVHQYGVTLFGKYLCHC